MIVGIVGHHSRRRLVRELAEKVDADVVSVDPPEGVGCEKNHIFVMKKMLSKATAGDWCVILEDDSQPVENFRTTLADGLKICPVPLVGMYVGTGNPSGAIQRACISAIKQAEATGASWLTANWFTSSVAYAIKAENLSDAISYIQYRDEELPLRLTRWQQDRGFATYYTVPSLCDHADVRSIIVPGLSDYQRQIAPRKAHVFGPRTRWNGRAISILGDELPPWTPVG